MAKPTPSFIQLPLDTGNTGKKVRSQTRVVGSDIVHEHFFIGVNPRDSLGLYWVSSGLITPPAAADNGTSTGRFWLVNPAGSVVGVAIRAIHTRWMLTGAAVADISAQRLAFALFTETGAPSGASVAYAKRDSTDPSAVSSLRTAVTGMTVTVGNVFRADLPPAVTGTTGVGAQDSIVAHDRAVVPYEEHLILRAGEGVLCYCPDAGTASSPRRAVVDVLLEEFTP